MGIRVTIRTPPPGDHAPRRILKGTDMRKVILVSTLSLLALANTACEPGLAYGDANSVIVVAPPDWWPSLEDSVQIGLSPDVWTVRLDHTFRVTYKRPTDDLWYRFHEVVLIGSEGDPWLAEALATLPDTVEIYAPEIYEAEDVWARNQNVTIILVDPEGDIPYQVNFRIPTVHRILEDRFLAEAEYRMFVSGRDTALADTLLALAGFSLILPEVYDWGVEDSVYVFRNDNPDPAELIRQFTVTWRTPIPLGLTADSLLDWREAIAAEYFPYPQVVDREGIREAFPHSFRIEIFEVRGVWSNPPGSTWPAAGAVITWAAHCPLQDRMYLVDAWLYSPSNERDKWEYMLQLETILKSFRCGEWSVSSG